MKVVYSLIMTLNGFLTSVVTIHSLGFCAFVASSAFASSASTLADDGDDGDDERPEDEVRNEKQRLDGRLERQRILRLALRRSKANASDGFAPTFMMIYLLHKSLVEETVIPGKEGGYGGYGCYEEKKQREQLAKSFLAAVYSSDEARKNYDATLPKYARLARLIHDRLQESGPALNPLQSFVSHTRGAIATRMSTHEVTLIDVLPVWSKMRSNIELVDYLHHLVLTVLPGIYPEYFSPFKHEARSSFDTHLMMIRNALILHVYTKDSVTLRPPYAHAQQSLTARSQDFDLTDSDLDLTAGE